jgi:hypothetical protein
MGRLAADLLTASALLMVALTLMFVERPGARWVALVGLVWLAFVVAVDFNLFGLQQAILGQRLRQPINASAARGLAGRVSSAGTLILILIDFFRRAARCIAIGSCSGCWGWYSC